MATDHNFKVKNGLDVLGGKASIAASTSTSSSNALKLHVGTINNTGSSAIAQFGGFIRASEYYILHETTGSGNSIFIDYAGNDLDVRAGEGNYTGVIRTNGYKVGTTTVIDSSRNIMGAGINSTANYTEIGTTTASNLVFKRTNASYIQADGSGGYFIFITNGRSTSYANRALALTTDNNAEFGGAINTVGNVTVGGNLTVNGTTTTLNTATLQVEDKNIVLNYASGDTSSTADGAGITIQDAVNSSTDATMSWDATNDRFRFSHWVNVAGNLSAYHIYGQDHYVLNAAADGWHRWAQRSGGKVNLDVNTISGSSITASSGMVVTDISSTGRGIYRNNSGYDLRVGGGTNSNTGAYISISGETRGGSNSAYNGRIEYYSGGTGFANQAAILGDHVWYSKHAGGSAHLMTLDSATGHLNLKLGGFYLNGTTVIDSSRNFYAVGMTTTSGVTIGGGLTTGTINVNPQDSTNEGGEIVLKGAGSNEDINIDNYNGTFRIFDGSAPQVRLSIDTSGNATFGGTISSGAITSSGIVNAGSHFNVNGSGNLLKVNVSAWSSNGNNDQAILWNGYNSTIGDHIVLKAAGNGTTHGAIVIADGVFSYGSTTSAVSTSASLTAPLSNGTAFTVTSGGNAAFAGGITTSANIDFTTATSLLRNQDDNSGQIGIQVKNSSGNAREVRWDAANNANGAWRATSNGGADLGLTNKIWNNLFVNTIKMGTGNVEVIDSIRNISAARIRTNDGTPSAPTHSFTSDTDTGMYRNSADIVGIATGGARRAYFASSGIHSDANVYATNDFRNYGGSWIASTGLTGNGFSFINSVDGTAMTLSSTGDMTVTNHVAINNFTLSADVALGVRGHGTSGSKYIFSAQDSAGSTKFYVRDDGVTVHQGSGYLYAASSGTSFYSQSASVFRGNISNDQGDLTLADHVDITSSGTLKIAGTQVISASRDLTNIGSISSGAITTSGDLTITKQTPLLTLETASNSTNPEIRLKSSGGFSSEGFGIYYDNNVGDAHFHTTYANNNAALKFYTATGGSPSTSNLRLKIGGDGNFSFNNGNFTSVGTISSGSITAGNSSTAASLRAHYNDGSYMTLVGYGLEMNRGASYIRPTTDGDKTLYIGGADASLDWNAIHFRSVNGLYMTGTRFIDTSRNLSNIGTISSGAITSTGRSTFDSVTIDDDGSNSPLLRVVADDHGPWAFQLENASATNSGLFQAYVNNNNNLYFRAKETGAYPTWYFQISNGSNHVNSLYLDSSGMNSAGHVNGASFKVSTTTVITSSRGVQNVTLLGGTTGARFQSSNWIYDDDNDGRLYFAINGPTYYKSTSGHRFRANGDVTRLTINADGAVNLVSGGDTNAPGGAALAVSGTSVLTTGRVLQNVSADTTASISPLVRGSVSNVNNTGYVHAFKVDGSALASQIRFTVAGTVGSVVISNDVSIVCNHYRDILIESTSGFYTVLTIKVVSNGNEDFSVYFKSNSANTATVSVVVFPLNDETVTITTTDPGYSGKTLEHTCDYGKKFSATNNTTPDQFDITTDGDIDANKYQINGTTVIGADRTVRAADGAVGTPTISFSADTNTGLYRVGSDKLGFVTAGTYRGMFDNLGRLLIGTTSTTPGFSTDNGHAFHTGDASHISRSGGPGIVFNRAASNGEIVQFRYNGNHIGGIGVEGGDSLYIQSDGTGGGGLRFHNSGRISPVRNGALIDNTIDLGASTQQFASLYVGTGLYMGGTQIVNSSRNLVNIGTITASTAGSSLKGPVYIGAQNTSGEGGEITLNGSNGNTNHTLDTVNGYFRIFDTSGTLLSGNSGYGLNVVNGYRVDGTQVITSSRVLQNVTASGDIITSITTTNDPSWHDVVIYSSSGLRRDTGVEVHGSGYLRASYLNMSHSAGNRTADDVFYSSNDTYIRKNTASGFRTSLDVYSKAESVALFTNTGDIDLGAGSVLTRSNHHTGHMEGSYNNVAANGSKSNPIYTIGSNYNPTDAALSNMYGIGYSRRDQATFLSSFRNSGWGFYVAADGDARVFLDGSSGIVASTGGYDVGNTNVINASRHLANVTVTSAEAEYGQSMNGNFGQWQAHSTYTNFDTDVNYWGWNYVQNNTNAPHTSSSQWYRNRVSLGDSYGHGLGSGDYWLEMAYPRYGSGSTPGHMYIRTCENGSVGSWYEVGAHLRGSLNVGTATSADINLGSDTTNARLIIKKDDNNQPDHIQIFCDGTQTGEIGSQDTTWLRINQTVVKNIYTPRYIRADSGFFVDNTATGLDGSGRLRAFAGSTSSVGIGFANDIDTGFYQVAANVIGVVAGGAERARLNSDGIELRSGKKLRCQRADNSRFVELFCDNNFGTVETGTDPIKLKSASYIRFTCGGNDDRMNLDTSGNLVVVGNVTAYGSISDIRLKENIEIIPDAIEKVQKLEGITFNYKKDGGRSTGLIAQQLQEVLPEVVYTTKDLDGEEHLAVKYGNVVGLLVEAIKEQQTQLTAQQEQINQLTNLVNTLMEK